MQHDPGGGLEAPRVVCSPLFDTDTSSFSEKDSTETVVRLDGHPARITIFNAVEAVRVLCSGPAQSRSLCRLASKNGYIFVADTPKPLNVLLEAKDEESSRKMEQIFLAAHAGIFNGDHSCRNDDESMLPHDSIEDKVARTNGLTSNDFDRKTDQSSAELYFHYYGMLQHQQNMLQDYIRTGTYFSAITENPDDFRGKAVLDVGSGSGILSLFAAQAGARIVYAIEASGIAHFATKLAAANPELGSRIKLLHCKVEEASLPEKVDVLISEPMGTLLVNERMLETYVYARDAFMKPDGKMFPRIGRIHVAAFCDPVLHAEIAAKSLFWQQNNFYGVDLRCLHADASSGYYSQMVVDAIPPNVLVSNCASKTFDFSSCTEADLQDVTVPLSLQVAAPCTVHGIATWFDVLFDGSTNPRYLSTAPGLPTTHWFQLRCVLDNPITINNPGETISGMLRLKAHSRQSYDIFLKLRAPPVEAGCPPQERFGNFDLKEPYYRQLVTGGGWWGPQNQTTAANSFEQPESVQENGNAHCGVQGLLDCHITKTDKIVASKRTSTEDLLPI